MVYHDRFETTLLQLFVQQENSECFSMISAILFEVNIVAEQQQHIGNNLFVFHEFPLPITFYCPPSLPLFRRPWGHCMQIFTPWGHGRLFYVMF